MMTYICDLSLLSIWFGFITNCLERNKASLLYNFWPRPSQIIANFYYAMFGVSLYLFWEKIQNYQKLLEWNRRAHMSKILGFSDEHYFLVTNVHNLSIDFFLGIYYPLITGWIESTQSQILFSRQMQNRDTELNSKYCLKEYFNIA